MRVSRSCDTVVLIPVLIVALTTAAVEAIEPDHPIITEVYTDPPGANDGPVGRDVANEHQEFIELYLPAAADLNASLMPFKDALLLTFYEVEGDASSSGLELVNYRFDLPPFDLEPGAPSGLEPGSIPRPDSGVVVLGWVDYDGDPPTALKGVDSDHRVALVLGGITSEPAAPDDFVFVAINGNHFGGTTNFATVQSESKIDLPNEAGSGVIQNGSGAYLLISRDLAGVSYVELCDDKHATDCSTAGICRGSRAACDTGTPNCGDGTECLPAGAAPFLPDDGTGFSSDWLLDGYGPNDHADFRVEDQPLDVCNDAFNDPSQCIDLQTVLPKGGNFTPFVAQLPETERGGLTPGEGNGYARLYVDVPKTTEDGVSGEDPLTDALNAYRQIRNNGPFFATPGRVVKSTQTAPELSVALAAEQNFEVLSKTTAQLGILSANVGGDFAINMDASPGSSSNPAVAAFGAGTSATGIGGQSLGFPTVTVTPTATAGDGQSASTEVTVTANNAVGGDPAVRSPIQATTVTATVLAPTTGLAADEVSPLQTTVFIAVQPVPAQAGVLNEFLGTDLATFVANNQGGLAQDTLDSLFPTPTGDPALGWFLDPATDINDGLFMQTLREDFPDPGSFLNLPGPGAPKLDLVQTVMQSAEQQVHATYDAAFDGAGLSAIRLNNPDTLTFGGTFSPSEVVQFVDAKGGVANPRSGLTDATTSRTFELAIVDTNVQDNSSLETGATDDFGIVIEVAEVESGSPVVPGEFVFLSFTGGLQGADLDTLDVPPGNNVANLIYLDLDNLHSELKIRSIELIVLVNSSGGSGLDVVEVFSLNPSAGCTGTDPCNDGLACTVDDTCNGSGQCIGTDINTIGCSVDSDCPFGLPCIADSCTCTACDSAANCNDGVACTVDACVDGRCANTPDDALCADDGLICTVEFCERQTGCSAFDPCPGECTEANGCPINPPDTAPAPHNRPKNRYISFDPANPATSVAFRVDLASSVYFPGATGTLGWVGAPDANGVSRVLAVRTDRAWPESVIHIGDCEISPAATYEIRAIAAGADDAVPGNFSAPLSISTASQPGGGAFWADGTASFGFFCDLSYACCDPNPDCPGATCPGGESCIQQWPPPDGVTNFNDVSAAIRAFQSIGTPPHTTWVDMHGAEGKFQDPALDPPNFIVNFADVQQIIKAFQGDMYPYSDPGACP